jgi:hypothetical protein
MMLSLMVLLLLATLLESSKTIIALNHVRVILLVLIVVVTLFVQILWTIEPRSSRRYAFMPLFLYADVDLILLYLLTYLPVFRKLKSVHPRK